MVFHHLIGGDAMTGFIPGVDSSDRKAAEAEKSSDGR